MTEPTETILPFPIEPQAENMLRDAVRTGAAAAGSGGGGSSGDLNVRVAVLETHMENLRKDVADLKSVDQLRLQLATLTGRVAHLPSKGYTVTVALAGMAVGAAFTTFQQQIQHFIHVSP